MTLLMTEGFDHQGAAVQMKGQFPNVSGVKAFVGGRFGGNAISLAGSSSQTTSSPKLQWQTPPGETTTSLIVGFAYNITPAATGTQPPGNLVIGFGYGTATSPVTVTINPTSGVITTAPNGASQTPVYVAGLWSFCEIQIIMSASNGSITVQNDGVTAVSLTGVSVESSTANTLVDMVTWSFVGSSGTCYIDDMYICDTTGSVFNTFLGGCHINTIFPTASITCGFTPSNPNSAGQNWNMVSEPAMDGDATYNTASNVGVYDTFSGLANLDVADTVLAVQTKTAVRQDDSAVRAMQNILISNGVQAYGVPDTLTQNYTFITDIFVNDPATSLAWQPAAVNALQWGYNITT